MRKLCPGCIAFHVPKYLNKDIYNIYRGVTEGQGRDETAALLHSKCFFPPVERRELTESVTDVRRMCTASCSNFCKYLAVRHIDRIPKSLVRRNLPRGQCESRLIDLFRNSSLFLCGFEAHTFERNAKLELKSGRDVGRPGEGSSA